MILGSGGSQPSSLYFFGQILFKNYAICYACPPRYSAFNGIIFNNAYILIASCISSNKPMAIHTLYIHDSRFNPFDIIYTYYNINNI
jgi:hypothetical protein